MTKFYENVADSRLIFNFNEDTVTVTDRVLPAAAAESFEDLAVALRGSEFLRMRSYLEGEPEMRRK